jgi:hypothetical protein
MANQKITDLVRIDANEVADDDLSLIVDRSALTTPTGETKNITAGDFAAYVTSSTDINALVGYPLSASNGGTGREGLTVDAVIVGNGDDSVKQIVGTNGYWLRRNPTTGTPEFADAASNIDINQISGSPLTVNNGGTGRSTLTPLHGVTYANGTSNIGITAAGTNLQVLTGQTGAPPQFVDFQSLFNQYSSSLNQGAFKEYVASNPLSFVAGNVIRKTFGGYALASALSAASAEVLGIVEYATVSSFTVVYGGQIDFNGAILPGVTSLTDGSVYFLSTTSGQLTISDPHDSNTSYISKPLLIATDTDKGVMFNWRGLTGTSGGGGGGGTVVASSGYRTSFLTMGA